MKAAIRRKYGPPEKILIEEIETPVPKDHEVLIKVFATTVNRTDAANLRAKPFIMRFILGFLKPRRIILGTDFAGEIVAIGNKVKSFQINDRVFGFHDTGLNSQAEYLAIAEDGNLRIMPEHISFQQAAASLEGAHYAYSFIHKVNINTGQKILINGSTGAIGSALLQLVRQYEVKITATCHGKDRELVHSLGADKTYDFTKEDFRKDEEKYDFIFDAVGKSTFGKCKPLLQKKGVYISSELGPYAQNIFLALFSPLLGPKKVIFPIPYPAKITIPFIAHHLQEEKFKPVIDVEYPLEKVSKAYKYVLSGEKIGNVILNIDAKSSQNTNS